MTEDLVAAHEGPSNDDDQEAAQNDQTLAGLEWPKNRLVLPGSGGCPSTGPLGPVGSSPRVPANPGLVTGLLLRILETSERTDDSLRSGGRRTSENDRSEK